MLTKIHYAWRVRLLHELRVQDVHQMGRPEMLDEVHKQPDCTLLGQHS